MENKIGSFQMMKMKYALVLEVKFDFERFIGDVGMPVGNAESELDSSDPNDIEVLGVTLFERNLKQMTAMRTKITIIMSPWVTVIKTI